MWPKNYEICKINTMSTSLGLCTFAIHDFKTKWNFETPIVQNQFYRILSKIFVAVMELTLNQNPFS